MFGLIGSVAELATDVVKVVAAPVQAAVELADAAIKPIAEVAEELVDEVKSLKE